MLKLMDYSIEKKLVKSKSEWCLAIGIASQNLSQIKSGMQTFRPEQIFNAAKLAGASVDYVYGLSNTISRQGGPQTPAELIRQALIILETK